MIDRILATYPPATAASIRSTLSTAMKEAQREGYVTENAAALARGPRGTRRGLPAPDVVAVRRVLGALEEDRLSALFQLLAGTGLRVGEATGLRWSDITGARIQPVYQIQWYPREDGHGRELVLAPLKTEAHPVAIGPHLQAILASHKARQNEERLAAGTKWRDTGLVFTSRYGEPVSESWAHRVLSRACERAGIRKIAPHDMRRFAASQVEDAMGREASQLLLGHTSPQMTERYVSVRDTMLERAAATLEEALG